MTKGGVQMQIASTVTARSAGCYALLVMPSDVAISTTNLTKRYGAVTALAGIDLVVPGGVTYGFLGPNGVGTAAFTPDPTWGFSCPPTRSIPT
jgi:hypothetical protein